MVKCEKNQREGEWSIILACSSWQQIATTGQITAVHERESEIRNVVFVDIGPQDDDANNCFYSEGT